MDSKEFSEKQIKVVGTTKVVAMTIEHQDPEYDLILHSDRTASETGWVLVARLLPRGTALPIFYMRWDHNKRVLDIDIHVDGKYRKDLWNQTGYSGHHSNLTDSDAQEYEVYIQIPDRTVFKGVVRVGLLLGLNLNDSIPISEHVNVQIN